MNTNKFLSRKYTLAVLTLLVASGLRYFMMLESTGYVTIVLAVLASYNISNVFESKNALSSTSTI
jgi:hypothetical protein